MSLFINTMKQIVVFVVYMFINKFNVTQLKLLLPLTVVSDHENCKVFETSEIICIMTLKNTRLNRKTDQHSVLAAITSTVKTDLILRLIKAEIKQDFLKSLKANLCDYLQMETIPKMDNVLIHKRSPYHKLNGIIIVFNDKYTLEEVRFDVTAYSRTPSQVLALIRYIYDAVPFKILITTADQKVTAKLDEFSSYNDTLESPSTVNNLEYASSILNRTSLVLEYLDRSMIKMNESKDPTVRDKIGKVIDLLACGQTDYNKLRAKMSELGAKGVIKMLGDDDNSDNEIEVDSD